MSKPLEFPAEYNYSDEITEQERELLARYCPQNSRAGMFRVTYLMSEGRDEPMRVQQPVYANHQEAREILAAVNALRNCELLKVSYLDRECSQWVSVTNQEYKLLAAAFKI